MRSLHVIKEKKLAAARILCRTGLARVLHPVAGARLVVLNYHRIRRDASSSATEFEDGVFGPTALEFHKQMEWISKHTELLNESELVDRILSGRSFGAPSCLVTFDDAYVDNYELAFPILRKMSVPAIFFIPTALVSSRQLGWWDVVAYLVKRSTRPSITVGTETISLDPPDAGTRRLIASLKRDGNGVSSPALARIAEACGVDLPGPELQSRELMTWEQLREVSRNGITIGSHTHNHLALSRLDRDAQRAELSGSKQILEHEIGKPVRSVAYPFGGTLHFDPDSKSIASECGYDLAFTFQGRPNRGTAIDRYGIKRLRAPDQLELMIASILVPSVFSS